MLYVITLVLIIESKFMARIPQARSYIYNNIYSENRACGKAKGKSKPCNSYSNNQTNSTSCASNMYYLHPCCITSFSVGPNNSVLCVIVILLIDGRKPVHIKHSR